MYPKIEIGEIVSYGSFSVKQRICTSMLWLFSAEQLMNIYFRKFYIYTKITEACFLYIIKINWHAVITDMLEEIKCVMMGKYLKIEIKTVKVITSRLTSTWQIM